MGKRVGEWEGEDGRKRRAEMTRKRTHTTSKTAEEGTDSCVAVSRVQHVRERRTNTDTHTYRNKHRRPYTALRPPAHTHTPPATAPTPSLWSPPSVSPLAVSGSTAPSLIVGQTIRACRDGRRARTASRRPPRCSAIARKSRIAANKNRKAGGGTCDAIGGGRGGIRGRGKDGSGWGTGAASPFALRGLPEHHTTDD